MKKFLRRIGKIRFMILCFIVFAAISYYFNGWCGVLAAALGWWLGIVIYNWKEYKLRIIKFFRQRTKFQIKVFVKLIILIPIAVWCFWYAGWLGIAGCAVGWVVGELICKRFLKLK